MRGVWPLCLGLLAVVAVARTQEAECEEALTISSGSGSLVRWTYDKSQKQCKTFVTKDTQIVSNVFLTEVDCLKGCSAEYNQLYPSGDAACELLRDPGPCLAHIIMWYYDQQRGACDTFIWGGCQGNGNRFENKDDCRSLCVIPKKGKSGAGSDTSNDASDSQSDAGLIIGVVFGVVFGVAFLVTLAMYLVQRKKMKKQKHKKVPDTEMK